MTTTLSIKNAPDRLVQRVKERAALHQRSVEHELLAIVTAAVASEAVMTPMDVLAAVQKLGLSTACESVALIRADRDGR